MIKWRPAPASGGPRADVRAGSRSVRRTRTSVDPAKAISALITSKKVFQSCYWLKDGLSRFWGEGAPTATSRRTQTPSRCRAESPLVLLATAPRFKVERNCFHHKTGHCCTHFNSWLNFSAQFHHGCDHPAWCSLGGVPWAWRGHRDVREGTVTERLSEPLSSLSTTSQQRQIRGQDSGVRGEG